MQGILRSKYEILGDEVVDIMYFKERKIISLKRL